MSPEVLAAYRRWIFTFEDPEIRFDRARAQEEAFEAGYRAGRAE